jgi:hypothetical protein
VVKHLQARRRPPQAAARQAPSSNLIPFAYLCVCFIRCSLVYWPLLSSETAFKWKFNSVELNRYLCFEGAGGAGSLDVQ